MKPFLTSSVTALVGALLLAGCAVAPVDGPYAYGYDRPYYYDQGPVYYEPWPYYGYYYGPPAFVGRFRWGGGDRHWDGGSWRHNSLTLNGDRTWTRASHSVRAAVTRNHAATRARASRNTVRHESDRS
jgi:hypothetical protein